MKKILVPGFIIMLALTVLSGWGSSKQRILPTSMRVTVIDYIGNVVEGAAVRLFLTEEDYRNETNQVRETVYTDKKGRATIKKLEPRVYYLYVTKDDMNNIGNGVQTDTLKAGKINQLNVVIE